MRRGEYVDPRGSDRKFGDLWQEFLASRRPNPVSGAFARDVSYGDSLILPHLGRRQIGRVDEAALQEWVSELTVAGKAHSTVTKALQLVLGALRYSVDRKGLSRLPERRLINIPKGREPDAPRFLTLDELGSLLGEFDGHFGPLVHTAAFTGLRWGELAGLKARDINLTEGHLTVNQALKDVRGQLTFGKPKWNSRRTIHLPANLVKMLSGSLAGIGDTPVFTSREGQLLRRSNFRQRDWLPAVRSSVGGSLRFHDLRHTHAAMLIANGENVKVIQERLGHKDVSTTLNIYGHLMPGMGRAAAGRLDDSYAKALGYFLGNTPESGVARLEPR